MVVTKFHLEIFVRWAYLNNTSLTAVKCKVRTSTRASNMGASPGLQGSGKMFRDDERKPNTHICRKDADQLEKVL